MYKNPEMEEDMHHASRKKKVEEVHKVCPLLSMANPKDDKLTRCIKEECAFYLSKLPVTMEKCIWVRLAISLGNLDMHFTKPRPNGLFQQSLNRRSQQQSPKAP
jgi:hypothetical protein